MDEQDLLNKNNEPKGKEAEPISGFYTKEQLKGIFVDRKKLYSFLKRLILTL